MDNKPSFRTIKIGQNIKRLLAEYLVTNRDYLQDSPNLRIEITDVIVSKDIRLAKIFLTHNVSDKEFENFNKKNIKKIQNLISKNLTTKYTPRISLIKDKNLLWS